jgi:hypothetical protein
MAIDQPERFSTSVIVAPTFVEAVGRKRTEAWLRCESMRAGYITLAGGHEAAGIEYRTTDKFQEMA